MDIQTDDDGFLLDPDDWSEDVAEFIANKFQAQTHKALAKLHSISR